MCFSGIRVSVSLLRLVITGLTFITSLSIGQDSSGSANQPPMRTNPQDVQLATLASSANTAPSDNGSSQDQWKSLTTAPSPDSNPMVTPSPSPTITGTNAISPLVAETKPKPIPKKDDYGPQTGWGLRAAVGPALQQSVSARSNGGADYSSVNFDPGFRTDFEAFYNVTNGFYFGLEGGFIYNSISSIYTSADSQNNLVSGSSEFGNGAFYQVPVLANIRFQIPNTGKLRGYCTGGVGVVWDYLTASTVLGTYSQHQLNYAFQLGAGFQYNLLPSLDLDTCFKTFITPNPLIFSDSTSQVKASYNYALEIGLAYRF
jgi:opacity protein-like surface antigen